jgi:suppressor of ftsI
MKKILLLSAGATLLLAACSQPGTPTDISVDHSQMDHGTMGQDSGETDATFLPGKGKDIASLPAATDFTILEIQDGQMIDLNPTLVRKNIDGADVVMYGYNGQVPGPLLKVRQGSTFTVNVRNDADVPTSVHWHGIRLANESDGAVGITQEEIEPGGSFRYTVTVPDEGMYWYHPHVREDIQQDMGLYGNILVVPAASDAYGPANREVALFLDDINLDGAGNPVPYGQADADHAIMGRFGNTMLVNWKPSYDLAAKTGEVVRLYLTNAANTRTFRFALPGARMKLVGGDSGRVERETFVDSVTLSPSERAIVDVLFEKAGTVAMRHVGPTPYDLGRVAVSAETASPAYGKQFTALRTNADVAAELASLRAYADKPADHTVRLSVELKGMEGMDDSMDHAAMGHGGGDTEVDGIEWEDDMQTTNIPSSKEDTQWKLIDQASAKENMDIDYTFKKGQKVKIRIVNDTQEDGSDHPMQHPIHFHGQRFAVLSVNGKPNDNLVWKDTVLVPKDATVDILLDASNPGDWMFHCHISEHLSNGMMGMFTVSES